MPRVTLPRVIDSLALADPQNRPALIDLGWTHTESFHADYSFPDPLPGADLVTLDRETGGPIIMDLIDGNAQQVAAELANHRTWTSRARARMRTGALLGWIGLAPVSYWWRRGTAREFTESMYNAARATRAMMDAYDSTQDLDFGAYYIYANANFGLDLEEWAIRCQMNYNLARIIFGEGTPLVAYITATWTENSGVPVEQRGDPIPQSYADATRDHLRATGSTPALFGYASKARIQAEIAGTAGPDTGPTLTWAEVKDSPIVRLLSSSARGVRYPATA